MSGSMRIESFCPLVLADSSVNGIASDVRLPHYIHTFVEQGLVFWGGGQLGGGNPLWFFK